MLRFLTFGAFLLALASAFVLYAINYKTRQIAVEVAAQKSNKDRLISRISVLKAERAFLSRAENIGPLAEELGMRPLTARQFKKPRQFTKSRQIRKTGQIEQPGASARAHGKLK